jgi:heme a synthase
MTTAASETPPSPWPHRLAVATWLAAIPLLLFGGTITTLEAGMAIDGWWILEPGRGDHFLLFYPFEKWFRDMGTFSEHTHRLFGILVGNLAIATVVVTWLKNSHKRARFVALGALLLVCFQGYLGGSRVLDASPQLAFLHGALAQIVFAYLAFCSTYLSPRRQGSRAARDHESGRLLRLTFTALIAVYAAIFAGAWLRHAFSPLALGVHIGLVVLATWSVVVLARSLKRRGVSAPSFRPLRRAALWLHLLIGLQIALGLASFWVVVMVAEKGSTDVHHSAYPTLHVLFGALVLSKLASTTLWARHQLEAEPSPENPARSIGLEVAS